MDTYELAQNRRKKTHIEYPMLSGRLACGAIKGKNYYVWTMWDLVTCKKCRKYIKSIKNEDEDINIERIYSVYENERVECRRIQTDSS